MPVIEQFKTLSEERFLSLYEALSERGYGPLDHEVAKLLKFRPQAIRKLPLAKRAQVARQWIASKHNAELCYDLFGTYLVRTRRELVTGFLDATGVAHEDGIIQGGGEDRPDPAKLEATVKDLDARFSPEDVTLYLAVCAEQWPDVPEITALWKARAGLSA